jgi:hypothetical protein
LGNLIAQTPDYVWNDIWSDTMLYADTTGNRVTNILILPTNESTWAKDRQAVVAFGTMFLPPDVSRTNLVSNDQGERHEYTSRVGKITLVVN